MKRLYEPLAYAPRTGCWWDETSKPPFCPTLTGDLTVDAVVVGAGFTGLSAARELAQSGLRVAVLDAETPGFGASGRNGGFCCLGGGIVPWSMMVRTYGAGQAHQWAALQRRAVDHVAAFVEDRALDVDRHSNGETVLAHAPRAMAGLRSEAAHLAEVYGISPTVIEPSDLTEHGIGGRFFGGLTTPIGFGLNPAKYLAGLAVAADDAGAALYGRSPVLSMDRVAGRWAVRTPEATVSAQSVILATNGYSSEDVPPWLRGRTLPVQSRVIVTRPLSSDELAAQGWLTDQMAYDTRFLLHYFRKLPDNRFLFGMRGGLRDAAATQRRLGRMIRAHFHKLFPAWRDVEITHDWSGLVCLLGNGLPFVGPVPDTSGLYAALGFHGNGVAMGSLAGTVVAGDVLKRPASWVPGALRAAPKRFPLGRYRRALLLPAYLASRVLDR